MQVASMRYSSIADFSGSALHILHRGSNYITYIATAQQTGLKLLLKAYDLGEPSYAWQLADKSLSQAYLHCIVPPTTSPTLELLSRQGSSCCSRPMMWVGPFVMDN